MIAFAIGALMFWNLILSFLVLTALLASKKNDDEIEVIFDKANQIILEALSANAVQGWRIGKPTEQGKYMVTIDSFGYKHIDFFYYGKPMMPNRKVRGNCWYRSDDEWGDVVYDDTDILAWQPLPKPYKGGAE